MLLRNLALVTTLAVGAPSVALATPTAPAAVETVKVQTPAPSSSDATRYAEREKQDHKAADFRGGELLVVGVSGGALLVFLLLVLILI